MKKSYICLFALLGTMLFASCTQKGDSEQSKSEQLVFLFQHISDSSSIADEIRKRTGIDVKFINYNNNNYYPELLSRLASSNLPDIIAYPWNDYPGGPEKAFSDGIIIPLNDVIDSYSPNLKKYINEHPEIKKDIISDSGNYYAYPFIREEDAMKIYEGPFFRKDWLDALSLPIPETVSEWETALTLFKDRFGASHPLANVITPFGQSPIIGAFGIGNSFYVNDGSVHFGPYEPQYLDYLTLLNRWYTNGLLGKTPAFTGDADTRHKVYTEKSGAFAMPIGSGMGQIYAYFSENGIDIELTAVPYPVLNKGEVNRFGFYDNDYCQYAITKSCKNIELAAQLLDYGYSNEGMLTYNFGTEGESYKLEDNMPVYTDLIIQGKQVAESSALRKYILGHLSGPFIQMRGYLDQYFTHDSQKEAFALWSSQPFESTTIPPITFIDSEQYEVSVFSATINEYVDDMFLKFVLGVEPLENFDIYLKELEARGIQRYLEIYNSAYKRYIQRGDRQ